MRSLKIILLVTGLILGGLFAISVLYETIFHSKRGSVDPELIDFHPTEFEIRTGSPFFYRIDGDLFYSKDGKLAFDADPIWSGNMTRENGFDCQVSPDNQYIAFVRAKKEIIIVKNDGKVIGHISPITDNRHNRKSGNFVGEKFQWSNDSKQLFVLNDIFWDEHRAPESAIFQYSVQYYTLRKKIHLKERCEGDFFFNSDYTTLYYESHYTDGSCIRGLKLDGTNRNEIFIEEEGEFTGLDKDSTFVNYNNEEFGNWDSKGQKLFVELNHHQHGFYLHHDSTNALAFKTKYGHSANGNLWTFQNFHSGFLPDDRYYYTGTWAKGYRGTIFIDAQTLRYSYKAFQFECFYSITNKQQPNFALRFGITPNFEFETSIQNQFSN